MKSETCLKEYIQYVSLNVLGMIGLSCYILADTYFVANGLGTDGLAALNLAIPIYSFIYGSGLMLGIGGANRDLLLRGRGRDGDAAFSHTLMMAVVWAAVFELAGLFSGTIAAWLGAEGTIFEMCCVYLRTLLFFAPAFLLNNIIICFVRSNGVPRFAMAAMLSGSFSNILLDYLFIFPLRMGMFGAVLATCMAPFISLGVLSVFFWRGQNRFHVKKCRLSGLMCRNILTDGLPSLVGEMSSGIVMMIFNAVLLKLCGSDGVAAYGVISNLSLVMLAVYNGIGQGIQPIVGRYHSSGHLAYAAKIQKYAVITVTGVSAVIDAVICFAADPITAAFNSEDNAVMQGLAVQGLRIYFIGGLFAGLNIVLSAYLIASDCSRPANVISLLRGFLVIIPFTLLLSAIFGITGLWSAFPLTELVVALAALGLKNRHQNEAGNGV